MILRPASGNAQFMRPVIVNRFPSPDIHERNGKSICDLRLNAESYDRYDWNTCTNLLTAKAKSLLHTWKQYKVKYKAMMLLQQWHDEVRPEK